MTINLNQDNDICIITINRPEALNSINSDTLDELSKALTEIETNHKIGVVVVTGAGDKAFNIK